MICKIEHTVELEFTIREPNVGWSEHYILIMYRGFLYTIPKWLLSQTVRKAIKEQS